MNDLLEKVVGQVVAPRAVTTTRTTTWSDFVAKGCAEDFDLVLFIPNNLFTARTDPETFDPWADGVRAVRRIKGNRATPIIVLVLVDRLATYEPALLAADADSVLPLPPTVTALKETITLGLDRLG